MCTEDGALPARCDDAGVDAAPEPALPECCDDPAVDAPSACLCLVVDKAHAKALKDCLSDAGLLDRAHHSREAGGRVALPCTAQPADPPAAVAAALCRGLAAWDALPLAPRSLPRSPAALLRAAVAPLLSAAGLPASLLLELPRKWERLGDLVMLDARSLATADAWASLPPGALHGALASALGARRVALQAAIRPGAVRPPGARLLPCPGAGEAASAWTSVREHGVVYVLDALQTMYCSGNGTEKARMGGLRCGGETVVDLFAGCGFYTLPLLVHAGAGHVYACELHPPTAEGLRRGLRANGVPPGRCTVLGGDCAATAPAGVAHRVLLGLLPSAGHGHVPALRALVPAGGVLHVHGLCGVGRQREWGADTAAALGAAAAAARGAGWGAALAHVETVKSYAPRTLHVVADVAVGPGVGGVVVVVGGGGGGGAPHPAPPPPSPPPGSSAAPAPAPAAAAAAAAVAALLRPTAADVLRLSTVAAPRPALLLGLDFGPPGRGAWTWSHLACCADGALPVVAHVGAHPALDAAPPNWALRRMPLARAARLARGGAHAPADAAPDEAAIYLRSVARCDARARPACLASDFPGLAPELRLPGCVAPAGAHSTVLRLCSPGLALWLHHDALHNVLVQLTGTKTACAGGLYLAGSSSSLPTALLGDPAALAARGYARYPAAHAARLEARMRPGDALFIPAGWAHAVAAGGDGPGVCVNAFWAPPLAEGGGGPARPPRDTYANADPLDGAAALQAGAEAAAAIARLPPSLRAFYASRVVAAVEDAAAGGG